MKKQIIAMASALTIGTMSLASTASAEQVKVNEGDTLWSLSQNNHVSVASLKKMNGLHSDLIIAGTTLKIGTSSSKNQKLYTIRIGDTLSEISTKTGVSVSNLKAYNKLSSDLIIAGTTLSLTDAHQMITPGEKPKVKKIVKKVVKPVAKKEVKQEQVTPVSNSNTAKTNTQPAQEQSASRTLTMTATAYTADCTGCSGITATGIDVRNSTPNIIAVDPNVIPLGSKVWVEGYGTAIAGDTGGAIKGNRIDLLVASHSTAIEYGVRTVTVKVLN